jgi:protocatechuate 3,4-dioxygenase beta subunit
MNRRQWIGVSCRAVSAAAVAVAFPYETSFASPGLSSRIRIAPAGEPGERMILAGRVVGVDGGPLGGIEIEAYHTDATGLYRPDRSVPSWPDRPPRLSGRLTTAADGSYEIDTVRPGAYPGGGNPAHIHFRIFASGAHFTGTHQGETLWFEGEPFLTPEQVRRETSIAAGTFCAIQPLARGADGVLRCRRDFRFRGGSER